MVKRVAIVEDNQGLREQLVQIIGSARGIWCAGIYSSAEDAICGIVPGNVPDIVLMDIKLPGMSGIECVAHLKKDFPALQIIMFTVYEESDVILNALRAGADGYLIKSSDPEELIEALNNLENGGSPMSGYIARKVVHYFHECGLSVEKPQKISEREKQILTLLSSGYHYKDISRELNIAVETVRVHVKNICKKMHVRNRMQAIAVYGRH